MSRRGYTAVPTSGAGGSTPSASLSPSLSPSAADQPYELELTEKGQQSQRQQQWGGLGQLRPPPVRDGWRRNQGLLERGKETVYKGRVWILTALCIVLGLTVVYDRYTFPKYTPSGMGVASSITPAFAEQKPYRLEDDIVMITKVGAATAHTRLPIHLVSPHNYYTPNHLYVADYPLIMGNITFFDALSNLSSKISALDEIKNLRGELHTLVGANQNLADGSEKDHGWILDKYKFLPAVAEAYRRWPGKKWYVMVEADTFLFFNQLVKWLGTLDHEKQLLLGHPSFCDYDQKSTMFTHGGSGIVMSAGLLSASFGQDPSFEHHQDELILKSAFGDALLSKSFYDAPHVNLTELSPEGEDRFNSEPPRMLKFHQNQMCKAIMSLHHITPADAAALYDFESRLEPFLSGTPRTVLWGDVWEEFQPLFIKDALTAYHSTGIAPERIEQMGWQAIEDWDSETTDHRSTHPMDCREECKKDKDCLMWQWQRVEVDEEVLNWAEMSKKEKRAGGKRKVGICRWTKEFVRIGLAKPKQKYDITTGWMPDRIEKWKKERGCDSPLAKY